MVVDAPAVALGPELVERVAAFGETLSPGLRPTFEALTLRSGLGAGASFEAGRWPLHAPEVRLPLWLTGAGRPLAPGMPGRPRVDEDVLLDILEAAVFGALHARLLDDGSAEGALESKRRALLGRALFARHGALLSTAVGSHPGFWSLFEERWARAGDSLLLEAELADPSVPFEAELFERLLDASRPQLLPGAAVLVVAGRWEELSLLSSFVDHFVRGHRLLEEVDALLSDTQAGRRTYVSVRVGGRFDLRSLVGEGKLDAVLVEARDELRAAMGAARALRMTEALPVLSARIEAASRRQEAFYRRVFRGILAGASRPG